VPTRINLFKTNFLNNDKNSNILCTKKFDIITCTEVIEHMDIESGYKLMKKALEMKPNIFICSTPNAMFNVWFHYKDFIDSNKEVYSDQIINRPEFKDRMVGTINDQLILSLQPHERRLRIDDHK